MAIGWFHPDQRVAQVFRSIRTRVKTRRPQATFGRSNSTRIGSHRPDTWYRPRPIAVREPQWDQLTPRVGKSAELKILVSGALAS